MRKSAKVSVSVCVAVLAVMAAACTGPPKGSVEWHKQEYLSARTREYNQEFHTKRHRRALIELGYLEQREFTVSNVPPAEIAKALHNETFEALSFFDFNEFAQFWTVSTNRVRVVGIPIMVEHWEKRIRQLDVPED
jgi:hypothetical protein